VLQLGTPSQLAVLNPLTLFPGFRLCARGAAWRGQCGVVLRIHGRDALRGRGSSTMCWRAHKGLTEFGRLPFAQNSFLGGLEKTAGGHCTRLGG